MINIKIPKFKIPKLKLRMHRVKSLPGQIFVTIRKRKLTTAAILLAIVAIFYVVSNPAIVGVSATTRELPIYCVSRDNKAVSLTFDAAWGNEDTEELIEIFDKYQIKVTFFIVGAWADKYPESVKALSDAGHEVMNHSNNHEHFSKLSSEQIVSNITASNKKISDIIGVSPTLFRPPYGEYDDNVIKTIRSMGMYTIQWDVDSLDWKDLSAADISKRVTSRVNPGSIVLFHNSAKHTPASLPSIIEYLISNGYSIVPVSELLLQGDYTIDHTGKMHPA